MIGQWPLSKAIHQIGQRREAKNIKDEKEMMVGKESLVEEILHVRVRFLPTSV